MRNDIVQSFSALNDLYELKLSLYKELVRNTEECNFIIASGSISRIDDKLEESNNIIEHIDLKDFDITRIKSEICRQSGIEYHHFEDYFLSYPPNQETEETKKLLDQMKKVMLRSLDNRDLMIKKIHEEQARVSSSIHSIARTRALNTRFRIMHY